VKGNRIFGATLVLAALLLAGGPARPAEAANAGITGPGNGAVITQGASVTVSASTSFGSWRLVVTGPGGPAGSADSNGNGTLSTVASIGLNGTYTVTLQHRGFLSWNAWSSSAFTVRVPPTAPGGVSASVSGRTLTVRWSRGGESDLRGYSVAGDASSRFLVDRLARAQCPPRTSPGRGTPRCSGAAASPP
jgi:hypothetical protein